MMRLTRLFARELLDSRGRPTVEVEASAGGMTGRAIVPSGASTGKWEACELRDRDANRYDGLGVRRAVAHVNDILRPLLLETDVADQATVDQLLIAADGTPQKTRLGGNALLGVSLAIAHLGAAVRGVPLFQHFHWLYCSLKPLANRKFVPPPTPRMPMPMTNMISGGLHAGGNIDFQDVLAIPVGAPDYPTGLEWIVRIYNRLGKLLAADGFEGRLVGDEGGFGPRLPGNREAVEYVVRAIEKAGLRPGLDVTIALDVAATHFWDGAGYRLVSERDTRLSSDQMIDRLEQWVERYPITSIEDGLAEDDWEGWERLTQRLGQRVRLVGDDLFTTNVERLRQGIDRGVANSVLIKINQIGTITETLRAMQLARSAGYTCVVSARSGETEDATIADLAVGAAGDLIKIGSIVRSERLAKYNQLLRIAESLPSERAESSATTASGLTSEQVRALDESAAREFGMPSLVLMENAGRSCADLLESLGIDGPVVIVCGRGNNGGDGLVLARHLDLRGYAVRIVLVGDFASCSPDAAANLAIVQRSRLPLCHIEELPRDESRLESALVGAAWIVDALLGIGARGNPRPPLATVIERMNALPARKFAIDLPSGLDANTGQPGHPTFRADITCSFVAPKAGFQAPSAAHFLGEVRIADIGAPRTLVERFVNRTS